MSFSRISPTCQCAVALCIWWPSWTGTSARFWPGVSRTRPLSVFPGKHLPVNGRPSSASMSFAKQTMRGASFALGIKPSTRHQSQDSRQVAQAPGGLGSEDRSKGAALNGLTRKRTPRSWGSDGTPSYRWTTASMPSPLDPTSDPIGTSSVPSQAWHLSLARCRWPLSHMQACIAGQWTSRSDRSSSDTP